MIYHFQESHIILENIIWHNAKDVIEARKEFMLGKEKPKKML
jgi:hypothetical protein